MIGGASGHGLVAALTLDDGPNGVVTERLLDFLAEKRIRATFCVVGQSIEASCGAAVLRRIVAEGHLLASHSTSFADMGQWSALEIERDLLEDLPIIRHALDDPFYVVPYFRAPNGSWGRTSEVAAQRLAEGWRFTLPQE